MIIRLSRNYHSDVDDDKRSEVPLELDGAHSQAPRMPETSTKAILAVCFSGLGIFMCPGIGSIVGLTLASKADKEISESNGWVTGLGLLTAARVLGWVGVAYALLLAVFYAVFFLSFPGPFTAPESETDAPRPRNSCEGSAWLTQSKAELAELIPGGDQLSDVNQRCYRDGGGDFYYNVNSPVSTSEMIIQFGEAARRAGWKQLPRVGCWQKQIAGVPTYFQTPRTDGNGTDLYYGGVSSDREYYCSE